MATKDNKKGVRRPVRTNWTFLSNHAHVLLCLAQDPELRLRDVADKVGITERAVQRIVADLEHSRHLTRTRTGRRNRYHIDIEQPLRHPLESHQTLRTLLKLVMDPRRWDVDAKAAKGATKPTSTGVAGKRRPKIKTKER